MILDNFYRHLATFTCHTATLKYRQIAFAYSVAFFEVNAMKIRHL